MNKLFDNISSKILEGFEQKNTLHSLREIRRNFAGSNIREINHWLTENYPEFCGNAQFIFNNLIYQPKSRINNISEAIVILGKYKVLETLLIHKILKDAFNEEDRHIRRQFYHNISTAVIAHYITPILLQVIDTNFEIFTAGFFHNFGKMLMLTYEKGIYLNIFDESKSENLNFFEVENKVFARSLQILLAVKILRFFEYQDKVLNIIEFYRSPNLSQFPRETSIIHLSDIFVSSICIGETGDNKLPQFNKTVLAHFQFTPELLRSMFKMFVARLADVPAYTSKILF